MHGSNGNITPFPRANAFLVYNAVSNRLEKPFGVEKPRPWFLAGGLNPSNVVEAVRLSGAPMVDVSSGVERAPGVKEPALIRAFLEAVGTLPGKQSS